MQSESSNSNNNQNSANNTAPMLTRVASSEIPPRLRRKLEAARRAKAEKESDGNNYRSSNISSPSSATLTTKADSESSFEGSISGGDEIQSRSQSPRFRSQTQSPKRTPESPGQSKQYHNSQNEIIPLPPQEDEDMIKISPTVSKAKEIIMRRRKDSETNKTQKKDSPAAHPLLIAAAEMEKQQQNNVAPRRRHKLTDDDFNEASSSAPVRARRDILRKSAEMMKYGNI